MLIYYIMDNLKLLNIDLNKIFIIVGAFLLAVLVYNQLINISSMLVIPSNRSRDTKCQVSMSLK
jgi:hypothetical protein